MPGRSAAHAPRAPLPAARGADAVSGRSDQTPAPSTTHGHLWTLPEGTGLHAPLGRLVEDPATGRLCCHLCGRWFVSLGAHVRTHGYTADAYRDTMQLLRTRPLISTELSTTIATRQARAYADSAQVRERFAESQQLARTGQLTWRARAGNLESWQRLERVGTSRAQLAAGRATRARHREAHIAGAPHRARRPGPEHLPARRVRSRRQPPDPGPVDRTGSEPLTRGPRRCGNHDPTHRAQHPRRETLPGPGRRRGRSRPRRHRRPVRLADRPLRSRLVADQTRRRRGAQHALGPLASGRRIAGLRVRP